MLERLGTDPLWAAEYDEFVHNVSFAAPNELIPFATALATVSRLTGACPPKENDESGDRDMPYPHSSAARLASG